MSMKTLGEVVKNDLDRDEVMFRDVDGTIGVVRVCSGGNLSVGESGWTLHLSRDHVVALRNHLDAWLRTGSLRVNETEEPWAFAVECPERYAEDTGMKHAICYDAETADGIVNDIRHETGETDAKIVGLWPRGE